MKKARELMVVGNWKMNPPTIGNARRLFLDIRERIGKRAPSVEVVIAPPFPFISDLAQLSPAKRIVLGAQDVFYASEGAYTGEVSLSMLKSVGAQYIIIGHSERRALGETDADIYKDIHHVVTHNTHAIVCVGERKRDKLGNYFSTVESQLRSALEKLSKRDLKYVSVAYEPVWAIGTGKNATPADAYEMKLFIQKIIADMFGRTAVASVRILYGGSVTPKNAEELLVDGQIDGFLVGGASLRASDFAKIVETARSYARKKTS